MQTTVHFATQQTRNNYVKTMTRLERAIATGRFLALSLRKRRQLWQRLVRYSRQLGRAIKPSLAAAMLTMGVCTAGQLQAQTFTLRTGAANPINAVSDYESAVHFADLDNDGDKDMVFGASWGTIKLFNNTGTATSPVFSSGTAITDWTASYLRPVLVDIDNDGDEDMFVSEAQGRIFYFPNLGTASSPNFPVQPIDNVPIGGYSNPFGGIDVGDFAFISFADIDGDGDQDAFIGSGLDAAFVKYFRNDGTATSPVFVEQTGANNPLNAVTDATGSLKKIAIGDMDGDGDLDALIGNQAGTLQYFRNTGTATNPVFAELTGANNPANAIDVDNDSAPELVDIDNDGDLDLFVGNLYEPTVRYYENTATILPVVWKEFSVQQQGSAVRLQWATQQEQQTKDFVVQHSTDGTNWTNIGTVKAAGNSASARQYQYLHATAAAGINYYRLLQRDLDNKASTSVVRNIRLQGALAGFAASVQGNQLLLQVREPMELRLLNAQGAMLRKGQFASGNHLLDLSQYPAGVYFVHGQGQTTRIVKQ